MKIKNGYNDKETVIKIYAQSRDTRLLAEMTRKNTCGNDIRYLISNGP